MNWKSFAACYFKIKTMTKGNKMPSDISVKSTDNTHEVIEMPEFLATMTDDELIKLIVDRSNQFKSQIAQLCLRSGIGEVAKASIERSKAKEMGLIFYSGIWVEPMWIIPNRFKRVIDEKKEKEEMISK